jgi:hypothetical protein
MHDAFLSVCDEMYIVMCHMVEALASIRVSKQWALFILQKSTTYGSPIFSTMYGKEGQSEECCGKNVYRRSKLCAVYIHVLFFLF